MENVNKLFGCFLTFKREFYSTSSYSTRPFVFKKNKKVGIIGLYPHLSLKFLCILLFIDWQKRPRLALVFLKAGLSFLTAVGKGYAYENKQ